MSANLSATALGWSQLYANQPKIAADTAKTWAEVPLTEAQTQETQSRVPLNVAQAGYYGAQVPYLGALTNKTAIEAAQSQIILNNMQSRGRNTGTTYQLPSDEEGGTTPPAQGGGGGGGNIGPGTPDGSSGTTRELMAYAPSRPAAGPNTTMLASAAPQPQPQLGFGGVAAGGPLMMGATTTQPVSPSVASALADPSALVADPNTGQMVTKAQYLASHPQTQTQPPPPPPGPMQLAQAGPPGAAPVPGSTTLQRTPVAGQRPQPGEYFAPLGVTVPPELVDSYWMALRNGANPVDALAHIRQVRNDTLLQFAYGGGTPEGWRKSVEKAYLSGFLDEDHYRQLHTHPELWMDTIRQLQNPETTARQDEAMRANGMRYSSVAHNYAWEPAYHAGAAPVEAGYQKNSDGTYTPLMLTPNELAARAGVPVVGGGPPGPAERGGANQPPAPGATTPGASKFDAYAAAIHGHEGSSPTMGNYGWIPSTKVAMARQFAPDAVKGMSDEQIVAAQLSPDAEQKMLQGFTANNAVKLTEAGIRASTANLGMAHYIGAQGVKNLATVPPDMTMTQMEQNGLLAKGSVAGNRELQGNTTARGFIQWAQKKYGNTTLTADDLSGTTKVAGPGVPTTPPAATPPAATPPAPGATPTAPAPGQYQGMPQVPEALKSVLTVEAGRIAADQKIVEETQTGAMKAQAAIPVMLEARSKIPQLESGAGGDWRASASNWVHTYLGDEGAAAKLSAYVMQADPKSATAKQEFIKQAFAMVTSAEAQNPGTRVGAMLTNYYSKAMPNINMTGDAIKEMINFMLVGSQMARDYSNGAAGHFNDTYDKWADNNTQNRYTPLTKFDQKWTSAGSVNAPQVYLAASGLLNSHDWTKVGMGNLTPEQRREAVRIASEVDPSARFTNSQLVAPSAAAPR
jgi:hypothetical protein